ncbi:MAG TPA: sugar ABC transporter substrate-binding protein [Clostridiaceae bacterium]|nr:sugar ABC transporter substrate-binding protein [Clostridiaceae bacterium]
MKMKRFISIAVCICMLAVLVSGCGSAKNSNSKNESTTASGAASSANAASSGEEKTDAPKFKVGFSYFSFTDQLGAELKKQLEYVAKGFGCEIVFKEWTSLDVESMTATNEALIEEGCDGIISVMATPAMIEACDKAGVHLVQIASTLTDPEAVKAAQASDYYVGSVTANDYDVGYSMAKALYDAGTRNIAYISIPPGMSSAHDDRIKGIEKFAEEHSSDFKIITNFRTADSSKYVEGFRQIMAANPEIDGMIQTGNSGTVIATIYSDGLKDKVKFATVDVKEDTRKYLEDGTMVFVAGGQGYLASFTFVLLYSQMAGKPLLPKEDRTETLKLKYIHMKSGEDYDNYMKYIEGDIPAYSIDELKALSPVFNPDATVENLKKVMDTYSLEDVVQRHG